MDGDLCHFLPHPGLSLPKSLARSHALSAADPEMVSTFFLVKFDSCMTKLSASTPPLLGIPTGHL